MFSRFFIDRPIFATVLAIIIVLVGAVMVWSLPVARYPQISPPTISVSAVYPGANSKVVAETVGTPIEQEVNGVEGMLYMQSTSASDGSYNLTVTFDIGTDLDIASVMVQNRVAIAEPRLPTEVTQQGITTKKKSTSITMVLTITSDVEEYDTLFMGNYALRNVKDELARLPGVGEVVVFGGADYSMRVWLDPAKLKARNLTTNDVVAAIREQNVQVAAGQIGQPPVPDGQTYQLNINTLGRLSDVVQFEDLIVKADDKGGFTRVKDVARVELGGKDYNLASSDSGKPAVAILVYQLPGANALDVASSVKAKIKELEQQFPQGMKTNVSLDTTEFVNAAIKEVEVTLYQAVLLVVLVIFVFLQDWRATLVPAVTIPVSLVGTFAVMAACGYSINLITLFGLVLAIGIVVDDAIVVVENTMRHISAGQSSRDAAVLAMQEVSGPVVATTLVLLAVFIPTAFLGGITGQLYRQFAITISAATVLSSINALTLSPAVCALILRPETEVRKGLVYRTLRPLFAGFDFGYNKTEKVYTGVVSAMTRRVLIGLLLFVGLGVVTGWSYLQLPSGFLPVEDQGYLMCNVQLPDGASLQRTEAVVHEIDEVMEGMRDEYGIRSWTGIAGYSLIDGTNTSNGAAVFISLKPWDERTTRSSSMPGIIATLRKRLNAIKEARSVAFPPPAIEGLGVSAGFEMRLQGKGDMSLQNLGKIAEEVVSDANSQAIVQNANTTFRADVMQLFADIDRDKVKRLSILLDDVFATLQAYLGSAYVNDFNKFGRTYQVKVQADSKFRTKPEDIKQLDVRNLKGEMVPVSTFVKVEEITGPQTIMRYNMFPAAAISGEAADGFSSGQALDLMEQLVTDKSQGDLGYEWTGMSYQEKQVGSEAVFIFLFAILCVFLVLSAQYESWANPFAVVAVVPLAVLGAVAAVAIRQMDNNVYTQIGLVLLVAMASKNAILIVEFASQLHQEGRDKVAAAIEAARLRFRAILMTSFSFLLGVIPLLIASGAGAASRQAVGTTVFGGMIAATLFSVVFVPLFFVVVTRRRKLSHDSDR
ncbi:efflux RND transporter permease subunit [Aeoliella mucimassa]|uniref:Efflux pump membrane transporter BepE n=1 Tax=Aeoliella mucimassa TaxID=2527972 RepID=A0A518AIE5_9BACT|nr:multidrug efflux RND transporter permease subunit [Aeoliella mucimassa]QDU54497.1 Efflux pump membrane transporter BepE [Aeoliella mucimassa]